MTKSSLGHVHSEYNVLEIVSPGGYITLSVLDLYLKSLLTLTGLNLRLLYTLCRYPCAGALLRNMPRLDDLHSENQLQTEPNLSQHDLDINFQLETSES